MSDVFDVPKKGGGALPIVQALSGLGVVNHTSTGEVQDNAFVPMFTRGYPCNACSDEWQ